MENVRPAVLEESEVQSRLERLSGWELSTRGGITRTFEFNGFSQAMLFANAVGLFAEKMNHHPDIDIRWNKLTLSLITHSAKGLTRLDFELAEKIERCLE